MKKILIVDDDVDMCLLLNVYLSRKGYKIFEVHSFSQAMEYLAYNEPDLVICDVLLGDTDGISLLKKVKEQYRDIPFVFITAYDDLKTSANAMKLGAFDYVIKPLLPQEISAIIERAFAAGNRGAKLPGGRSGKSRQKPVFFYGNTIYFNKLHKQINLIATTNYSVIIQGESGTGKQAIAREIHHQSGRDQFPFTVFNCQSFNVEADGANLQKQHQEMLLLLQSANEGTVFLTDVAALDARLQHLLLRVISDQRYENPITGMPQELNVRYITSTTENLWHAAHSGSLLEGIYYKLSDFTIDVSPLRNRTEDIMLYARYFLQLANEASATTAKGFSPEVESLFMRYSWQDNLRELKSVVSKSVLVATTEMIEPDSLPLPFSSRGTAAFAN